MTAAPPSDPVDAGMAVVTAASAQGALLRLLGGVAVAVHLPPEEADSFRRSYQDVDFAAEPHAYPALLEVFQAAGYAPNAEFNSLHGDQRLMFLDPANRRQVDVFVGDFVMCHRIPFTGRLAADAYTIPLVELLLTKLQVVEINTKDLRDAAAIVATHPLGDSDEEQINVGRLADVVGADWGLYTTAGANLDRLLAFADQNLPSALAGRVSNAAEELKAAMEHAPKSRAWRLRARVGTRKRWYELPEEP